MSEEFRLDHLGIAVKSLQEGKGFYELLGLGPMKVEEVPSEQVRVGMFNTANGARLELLEPMSEDSAIHKFLKKRGPGIHHICLRVKNIREHLAKLKEAGVQLINEEPKPGADGCLVAFIHPKSTGGVLIELSEKD